MMVMMMMMMIMVVVVICCILAPEVFVLTITCPIVVRFIDFKVLYEVPYSTCSITFYIQLSQILRQSVHILLEFC